MNDLGAQNQTLIFFAGVHGVGKTTACKQFWEPAGFHCVTASSIIKAAKGDVNISKRVGDIDANQSLLLEGVAALRSTQSLLLIDGHFVVMNRLGEPEKIDICVFEQMNPNVIVCLRDDPAAILQRLRDRDERLPVFDVAALQDSETAHAKWVAQQLAVPFYCIRPDELPEVVKLLTR